MSTSLSFNWFPCPFTFLNHSHGPFLCKYWWHYFKSWILGRKVGFAIVFFAAARKWGIIYRLWIFQVRRTEAYLGLQLNSLGRCWSCFDILLVSELEKIIKNIPEIQNPCHPTLTAYVCGKIAPHNYVSCILGKVLISFVTWSALIWCYDFVFAFRKEKQISSIIPIFWPRSQCEWSDFKILSISVQFYV